MSEQHLPPALPPLQPQVYAPVKPIKRKNPMRHVVGISALIIITLAGIAGGMEGIQAVATLVFGLFLFGFFAIYIPFAIIRFFWRVIHWKQQPEAVVQYHYYQR